MKKFNRIVCITCSFLVSFTIALPQDKYQMSQDREMQERLEKDKEKKKEVMDKQAAREENIRALKQKQEAAAKKEGLKE